MTKRHGLVWSAGALVLASSLGLVSSLAAAAGRVSFGELVPTSTQMALEVIEKEQVCTGDHDAQIAAAYPLEWPSIAFEQGVPRGNTTMGVVLSDQGALVSSAVVASSGNPVLDNAATAAVRLTRFEPARHCEVSRGGSYYIDVAFSRS